MTDKEPLLKTSLELATGSDVGNHSNENGKQVLSSSLFDWRHCFNSRQDSPKYDQLDNNTEADDDDTNFLMRLIKLTHLSLQIIDNMPRTRGGKITKRSSISSQTTAFGSPHELSEASYVLVRDLSTEELVILDVKRLSKLIRAKPLSCGRKIVFRHGANRCNREGTYNEAQMELDNRSCTNNSIDNAEEIQKENQNDKPESMDISLSKKNDIVEPVFIPPTSPLQASINYYHINPYLSSSNVVTAPAPTPTPVSNPLPCFSSPNPITPDLNPSTSTFSPIANRVSVTSTHDNILNTSSSVMFQQPSSPTPALQQRYIGTKTSNVSSSTSTISAGKQTGNKTSNAALKEIKNLQSLIKTKDAQISKLGDRLEKLERELEMMSKHYIPLPTDGVTINWIDFIHQSVHKDDIREQIDLDVAASGLGIDRDTLDLCLELGSGDRISTVRQILKHCVHYDDIIQGENSWGNVDEDVVEKIRDFGRDFFGVSIKFSDSYVRSSMASMIRKDSWTVRNPEKLKSTVKNLNSIVNKTSSKEIEYHVDDENSDPDEASDSDNV